mgnify:CR=1 FL=1
MIILEPFEKQTISNENKMHKQLIKEAEVGKVVFQDITPSISAQNNISTNVDIPT